MLAPSWRQCHYNLPLPFLWSERCSPTVDDGLSWSWPATLGDSTFPICDVFWTLSLLLCCWWGSPNSGNVTSDALIMADWSLHTTQSHTSISSYKPVHITTGIRNYLLSCLASKIWCKFMKVSGTRNFQNTTNRPIKPDTHCVSKNCTSFHKVWRSLRQFVTAHFAPEICTEIENRITSCDEEAEAELLLGNYVGL